MAVLLYLCDAYGAKRRCLVGSVTVGSSFDFSIHLLDLWLPLCVYGLVSLSFFHLPMVTLRTRLFLAQAAAADEGPQKRKSETQASAKTSKKKK